VMSKPLNAEKGYARGVEVAGQMFFDSSYGFLNNFGVSASYSYVKTSAPLNFGSSTAPRIVPGMMPFQSKNNVTLSGLYESAKLSARLVYTWRSPSVFSGVGFVPMDNRYIVAYGILDGAVNYEIAPNLTMSFNASNITNNVLNRNVGVPGEYQTGIERQHYGNGRTLGLALRYKFGG
jgi:iron complex outermembrane receptor protein